MSKKLDITIPEILERKLLKQFPNLDELVERMLEVNNEQPWPKWCYLPMSASYAIVSGGAEDGIAQRYIANVGQNSFEIMSAIIPWRLHKIIYRFDPDFESELTSQATIEKELPAELLKHMPYPGIFIENVPGVEGCSGFFVFLEYDYRYPEAIELRLSYVFGEDIIPLFLQFTNGDDSLAERMAINNAITMAKINGHVSTDGIQGTRYMECLQAMPFHLSMLVYLLSDEPDISRESDVPRPRGKGIVKIPHRADQVDVGRYIGATIRMAREQAKVAQHGEGTHASPRPHMRRAHWHLYWVGVGRTVPRVKWLTPVFVNGEGNAVPTSIHSVKGNTDNKS